MGQRQTSNFNSNVFRERLKATRLKANLTQAELSERAGISGVTLSKLEQGVNSPTLSVLLALSTALNTSPNYLVGWGANNSEVIDPKRRTLLLKLEAASNELSDDWVMLLCDLAEKVLKERRSK